MAIKQTPELERIIQDAVDGRATDVFLIPGEPPAFRIGGAIQRTDGEPMTAGDVRDIAAAAVGVEALDQLGVRTGEVRTSCMLPGVVNGRMTMARAGGDVTVVISLAYPILLGIEATGAPAVLVEATQASHGLILVGGRVGSGKTTAALSLLDHINATRPVHICTVEDPIIVCLTPKQALVQQREVGADVPDTVAGIRAAFRQDSDVLYLSELKTLEEVDAALTAADTGHLVLAVVHGNQPEEVIQRFIDIQPEEMRDAFRRRLARVLRVVSVQCLLRKADGKGRVAAFGVLVPDDDMRRAIAEGQDVVTLAGELPPGSQRLADHVRELRERGVVDPAAADEELAGG